MRAAACTWNDLPHRRILWPRGTCARETLVLAVAMTDGDGVPDGVDAQRGAADPAPTLMPRPRGCFLHRLFPWRSGAR